MVFCHLQIGVHVKHITLDLNVGILIMMGVSQSLDKKVERQKIMLRQAVSAILREV